jgi:hypothetical protein
LQEYLADTNPTNRQSVLRLLSITASNQMVNIRWQGGSNASQYLERRMAFSPGNAWTPIFVGLPPTPGTNSFNDSNAVASGGVFYRVRANR